MNIIRTLYTSPALWACALLIALTLGMPLLQPMFAQIFPELERPIYTQDSFLQLLLAHVFIVALSSAMSIGLGVALGVVVTQRFGCDFKPLVEAVVAMGQTFPPVAVLAIVVPLVGFGVVPALIALSLYGLLPIVQSTIAGLDDVPISSIEAGIGSGMSPMQLFQQVQWPLARPIVLSGIRTSVIINIGTAAVASTVGAKTLGSPIIIGLNGNNMAYVVQGAVLVAVLAVVVDLSFDALQKRT